ncbi:folate-binding protein [Deinococcus radiomollis]|uniref:CAF17-like 4Fe-4S cluster assembly/insertion protein YgfZ n=1 Tax=Deinococcus radiomollis TaxID=468916 RepID=UPI0038928E5F
MTRFTRLPSSALRLTGPDRLDFVQGQMTAHIKAAPTPGMVPACFLNVRGQIEQFARVYRREGDVYLHLDDLPGSGEQAALLAARLKKYIIFDQVEVQDVSGVLSSLHLWPEQLDGQLDGWNAGGPDVQSFELGGAGSGQGVLLVGRVNRSGEVGLDVHYLKKHEAALLDALRLQEAPQTELEAARIAAGISDVVRDGWQGSLPQEVGQDASVSYRKGCYVGQEIMARLEARGNARHALTRLSGHDIPPHSEIRHGERLVGQTGGSTGELALAKLRKDLPEGAVLRVGDAEARVAARASTESTDAPSPI